MSLICINVYKTQSLAILLKPRVFAVTVTDVIFSWFIQRRLISFEAYSAGEQKTKYGCYYIIFYLFNDAASGSLRSFEYVNLFFYKTKNIVWGRFKTKC
jgi:hypothetical protein